MRSRLLFFTLLVSLISCSEKTKQSQSAEEQVLPIPSTPTEFSPEVYSIETFEKAKYDWGYRILKDGKQFINQPHIPAVQGNKGFSSQEKAQKTAELILFKLEAGIIPPTITLNELDSLNVLN